MADCVTDSEICLDREVHLNDIGTKFLIFLCDCGQIVDLSAATILEVLFRKPDKTCVVKTAVLRVDGVDGALQYITTEGDLDAVGAWNIQAKVTLPTGTWYSNISKFKVYANIECVVP